MRIKFQKWTKSRIIKTEARTTMRTPPSDKIDSAYRFPDRIVLHGTGRLVSWMCIACEPYVTLGRNASAEELGQAVKRVIEGFRAQMPDPSDWKEVTAGFVRGVGAKSHKQLQQTSICCGLSEKAGQLEIQPNHNGGTSGDSNGFQPIAGATFTIPFSAPPAEVGPALLRGFNLCTSVYETAPASG